MGQSYNATQKIIQSEFGIKANKNTIKRIYNEYLIKTDLVIQSDDKLKKEVTEAILNTTLQLKTANGIINDLILKYKNENKPEVMIACSREIINQLAFQEKLLERLMARKEAVKVNNVFVTNVLVGKLREWQDSGFITIHKVPTFKKEEDVKFEDYDEDSSIKI